jgi:GntR family transcriptional regulator, galactonate operon transcriptional repressor
MRGAHGRVVAAIGEAIVLGRHAPGTLLPRESDLVVSFGVSRTVVREAVRALAAKGLVETKQKVGSRVRPRGQWNHFDIEVTAWRLSTGFDDSFVRDLIELRQITEPAAARLAASRATFEDIASIEAALRAMEKAESENDPVAHAEADLAFHLGIFIASHNDLMASLSSTMRQILDVTFKLYQSSKGRTEYSHEEDEALHKKVFEHISRGEPELAGQAMLNLIAAAKLAMAQAHEAQRKLPKAAEPAKRKGSMHPTNN